MEYRNEIVKASNYYPFGLEHRKAQNIINGRNHEWAFANKEFNEEFGLNWHDFGARNYQADLGRWMNIDAYAESFYDYSPYMYAMNNPIMFVDPDGNFTTRAWSLGPQDDYGLDVDTGLLVLIKKTDDETDTIYTGTFNSDNEFEKDGRKKTFSKDASNIEDVSIGDVEVDGIELSNDEAVSLARPVDTEGLTFKEGNLQTGLEVMEFISFAISKELNAWSFTNDSGDGLLIGAWDENSAFSSFDPVSSDTDIVTDKLGNVLGEKKAHVHTHPGDKNMQGGRDVPSEQDIKQRNKNKNKKYPHAINSRFDGWFNY